MFPARQKWQSLLAPPKKPEETALAAGKHWKRLVQMKKDVATLRRQSLPAGQQWPPPPPPADADAEPTASKPAEAAAKAAARRGSLGTHGAHPRDPIVKMAMRSRESVSRAAQLQARTASHLNRVRQSACTRMPGGGGGGGEHSLNRSFSCLFAFAVERPCLRPLRRGGPLRLAARRCGHRIASAALALLLFGRSAESAIGAGPQRQKLRSVGHRRCIMSELKCGRARACVCVSVCVCVYSRARVCMRVCVLVGVGGRMRRFWRWLCRPLGARWVPQHDVEVGRSVTRRDRMSAGVAFGGFRR
jgi:hypothetical protein